MATTRTRDKRQRQAIAAYAKAAGVEIVETFYDEAVSGADMIETRPGFRAMLERLLSNGVRTIVVETANRFARDLMVQETGYAMLKARGIELIAADKPDAFLDDTPTATMIRQILGAVSQFEKAMLVVKLRGARDRKRATGVKVEGRKSHAEKRPEVVALARQLHRNGEGRRCRCARSPPSCSRRPRQQERQAVRAAVDRQHAGGLTARSVIKVRQRLEG